MLGLVVGVQSTAAQAAELPVSNYDELTTAINNAASGDTIKLTSNVTVAATVVIPNKNLTIDGAGFTVTVPNPGVLSSGANNESPSNFGTFSVGANTAVTFANLTIVGGRATGGCMSTANGSTARFNSVLLTQGRGQNSGAGCLVNGGTMYLTNSSVVRNSATYGGGMINRGTMFIESTSFSENRSESSSGGGGAIENQAQGNLYINNSTFANNQSTEIGGAINNYRGKLRVTNTTFTGNVAYGSYGGGAVGNNSGDVKVASSLFAYNYKRSSGSATDPSAYVLDDVGVTGNLVNGAGVTLSYTAYQANLPSGVTALVGNKQYVEDGATAGTTGGSPNTPKLFAGGQSMAITNPTTGARIGASVFRPFLMASGTTSLVPLFTGSWATDADNQGTLTRFSAGSIPPVQSYLDRLAEDEAWKVVGTNAPVTTLGDDDNLVTTDAIGTVRPTGAGDDYPAAGSAEVERDDLIQVTLVVPKNGKVEGASIYGDVYTADSAVTIKASPDAGYVFGGWKINGVTCEPDVCGPEYTFNPDENIVLEALFVKGPARPAAPTAIPKTATTAEVTVNPGTAPDALAPTKYVVRAYDSNGHLVDGATCEVLAAADPKTCTVAGLSAGQTYTFDTVAVAGSSSSEASEKSQPMTIAAPEKPAAPTVELVNQGTILATVAPNSEGATPTSYVVSAYENGVLVDPAKTCTITDVSAVTLACEISGLDPLKTYTFAVEAINDIGSSGSSDQSGPITPGAAPDKPQPPLVKPSAVEGQVEITARPSVDGTTPDSIRTFVVGDRAKWCDATAPSWSCVISDLQANDSYQFESEASNVSGVSSASDPSKETALAKPDAPASVTPVIAGSEASGVFPVDVRVVPAATGGDADSWTIQAYDESNQPILGKTCTIQADADPLSCSIPGGINPSDNVTFTAVANNLLGSSTPSAPVGPLDFAAPTVPVPPTAEVTGLGEITVTVTPNTEGGTPSDYIVTNPATGKTCPIPAGSVPLSCVLSDFDPTLGYDFVVAAKNDLGTSGPSAPGPTPSVTPNVPPGPAGAPTVEVAGDTAAWIYFQPTEGGGTPTDYTAYVYGPDSETNPVATCTVLATANPLQCQVEGLVLGTEYQVLSEASNGIGPGAVSDSSDFITGPPTAPTAPPVVTVAGPGEVAATVEPNQSGGTPTTYDVYALDESGARIVDHDNPLGFVGCSIQATADLLSCEITGLEPTKEYKFETEATNGAGSSEPSDESAGVVADDFPATPAISPTVTGAGEVAIEFTPGEAGGTVQDYTAYVYEGGNPVDDPDNPGTPLTCTVPATANPLSCTITGLDSGKQYTFEGEANNGRGPSDKSAPSNDITPAAPAVPTNVIPQATAEGEVTVTLEPALIGGTASEYIVGVFDADGNAVDDPANPGTPLTCVILATANPLSCEVTGLDPTQGYLFDAKAKNFVESATTDKAGPVTPNVPPATPKKPTTKVVGDSKVEITVAPADSGAATKWIDVYVLDKDGARVTDPDNPTNDLTCRITVPAASCEITVPVSTEPYTFEAIAANDAGQSDGSAVSEVTIADEPSKPAKPSVAVDEPGKVTVTVEPAEGGGNPSEYVISRQPADGPGDAVCTIPATANPLSCSFDELDPAVQYMWTVVAENGAGSSPESPLSDGVYADIPPNKPAKPTVEVTGEGKIKITVTPNTSGATPTDYTFIVQPGDNSCTVKVDPDSPEQELSCEISGLSPSDGEYLVAALAQNGAGDSAASDQAGPVVPTKPSSPEAPTGQATAPGEIEVTVTPAEGGGTATEFEVFALDDDGNRIPDKSCTIPATANPLKCTISGLDADENYTFEAEASNGAGTSDPSGPSPEVPAKTEPKAPKSVTPKVAGEGELNATVVPDTGGSPADDYTVFVLDQNGNRVPDKSCTVVATANPLTCKISGLDPSKTYQLEAEANNSIGSSPTSPKSGKVTPGKPGTPPAPAVKVVADGEVEITGVLPTNGGPADELIFQAYDAKGKVVPGKTCTVKATAKPLSCKIRGLSPDEEYTFDSQAKNAAGSGTKSSKSKKVKPAKGPKVPAVETTVTGRGSVKAVVKTPAGGTKAKKYVVQAYDSNGKKLKGKTCSASGSKNPVACTISGLPANGTYTFGATGKNGKKTVVTAKKSKKTRPTTPAQPAAPKVTLEQAGAIRVTVPANKRGGTPTSYKVTAQPGGKSCTIKATAKPLSCVITGLNKNKNYTFTVTAINGAGKSSSSSRSKVIVPAKLIEPRAATKVRVETQGNKYGKATYTFRWDAPKTTPRRPVSSYLLTLNQDKQEEIFFKKKIKANKLSYRMTRQEIAAAYIKSLAERNELRGEVAKGVKIVVTIYAVNSAGKSPAAAHKLTIWLS